MMWPNSTFGFRIFWISWKFGISWTTLVFGRHKFPCADDRFFCRFSDFWSWPVATGFPCADEKLSISLPSLSAASGLEFWFVLASGLPDNPTCRLEALSIPGLLDAIGLFTNDELVATELVRFITVGLDFAQILFSSFCSCILFAILSVMQLSKLRFLAQQRELKGPRLNKWRRLFHSSRVKCPFVNVFAIWCLVSMYLIWILGSKNNPIKQPIQSNPVGSSHMSHCWTSAFDYHRDHSFVVFKNIEHRNGLRNFDARRHNINMKQFRTTVLGWSFGLILLSCARHDAVPQVSLCWWILGLTRLVLGAMKHFYDQLPKFQSWDTVHP